MASCHPYLGKSRCRTLNASTIEFGRQREDPSESGSPSSDPSLQVLCWLTAVFSLLRKALHHKQQKSGDLQPPKKPHLWGLGEKRLLVSGIGVGSAFLRTNHLAMFAPGMQLEGKAPARNSGGVALLWSSCSREGLTSKGPAGAGRAGGHSSLDRTQAALLRK